jgi:hypothetical protein
MPIDQNNEAVILYDSAGVELAVSDGLAIPVGTKGLLLVGSDGGTSRFVVMKAASVAAVAADPSLVVAFSPNSNIVKPAAASLMVTATAANNNAVTATLPAPGAGLFHYITAIELVKLYATPGVANSAGVIITSTNLPGNPAWTTEQAGGALGTAKSVINLALPAPLKSSVANTATTFVAPAQAQTLWRWNIQYYTGV